MPKLTFTFEYDPDDRMWDVNCVEAPGTHGRHMEPYEALLDSAYAAFDKIENPDSVVDSEQKAYAQLNLEFVYDDERSGVEVTTVTRTYSQEQLRRMERFNLGGTS